MRGGGKRGGGRRGSGDGGCAVAIAVVPVAVHAELAADKLGGEQGLDNARDLVGCAPGGSPAFGSRTAVDVDEFGLR